MATALEIKGVIPEFYNRNQYTAACFFYLNKNPELTINQFRQIGYKNKDVVIKTCRESVFDSVKSHMQIDRVMRGPSAFEMEEGIKNAEVEDTPRPTVMAAVLTKALMNGDGEPHKNRPNTEGFRAEAGDYVHANPDLTYTEFKKHYPENFLNPSFFDARVREARARITTKKLLVEGLDNMAKGTKTPRLWRINEKSESGKVKLYLLSVPPTIREEMTPKEYIHKTGHKISSDGIFYSARHQLKKTHGNPPAKVQPSFIPTEVTFPEAVVPTTTAQIGGRAMRVMAEIDLKEFRGEQIAFVRKIAQQVAVALMGDRVKVATLSDPPILEIRLQQ